MNALEDVIATPRRQASSLAELLPWFGQIAPGIVLCKDGSLLAAFRYEGEDLEGQDPETMAAHTDRFENCLRVLNDRCTLWSVLERRQVGGYPAGQFVNPIAEVIDRQWEAQCAGFGNAQIRQTLYLGYRFPNRSEAFLEALQACVEENDGKVWPALRDLVKRRLTTKGAVAQIRGQTSEIAVEFERIVTDFLGLIQYSLKVDRLFDENLLGALYERANLAGEAGPVSPPSGASYLDVLLATDYFERRDDQLCFRGTGVGEVWMAALSTTQTPTAASAAHIDRLLSTHGQFVLVQCFRFVDRLQAEAAIQDAEMFYRQEVKSVAVRVAERLFDMDSEKINTGQLHLAADAQQALVDLTAGGVAYGYYNMTLLALGDSRRTAQATCDALASTMRASGYTVIRERLGLLSAYLASMPGNDATLRWKLASSANLADLAPLRTISSGEDHHPLFSSLAGVRRPPTVRFPTPSGVALDFNPHEGDVGHTLIVGGTGGGKTSLLLLLIAMHQKYWGRTYCLDKDFSLMVGSLLLGGQHLDMSGAGGAGRTNPVSAMLKAGEELALNNWVQVLISASGQPVTSADAAAVHTAIQSLRRSPQANWRLRGLYALIAGANRDLAAKLAPYVDASDDEGDGGKGPYAAYFDNEADQFDLGTFVTVEVGGSVMKTPQLAAPFMDYAFWQIEQRLDGMTPTLIVVEEAWYMLATRKFAEKMEDWLRTFRKKRAYLVMATQNAAEIEGLENAAALLDSIATIVLVPSMATSTPVVSGAALGLSPAKLALLQNAMPKRDYLLSRRSLTRLVHAPMPSVLLALNDATSRPDLREIARELAHQGAQGWEMDYLRLLGLEV